MSSTVYLKTEMLRTVRNRRFFIFSLGFPVVLYLIIAGSNRSQKLGGIPFALYFMTGMVAWGSMAAVMAGGARIALERQVGWNRQLRITPLSARAYFGSKFFTGYVMAGISIVLLYALGISFGVSLPVSSWLEMTALILIGLLPFAVLGILFGHLLTPDSMGPAMGGITSLFAILGGAWGPVATSGVLLDISKLIPTYYLVQAGKVALDKHGWPAEGWIVMIVWTGALARLSRWVYARDTGRA